MAVQNSTNQEESREKEKSTKLPDGPDYLMCWEETKP